MHALFTLEELEDLRIAMDLFSLRINLGDLELRLNRRINELESPNDFNDVFDAAFING